MREAEQRAEPSREEQNPAAIDREFPRKSEREHLRPPDLSILAVFAGHERHGRALKSGVGRKPDNAEAESVRMPRECHRAHVGLRLSRTRSGRITSNAPNDRADQDEHSSHLLPPGNWRRRRESNPQPCHGRRFSRPLDVPMSTSPENGAPSRI